MVTGSTGGIGAAVVRELGSRRHRVVLAGRSARRLEAQAAELGDTLSDDGDATLAVDLADPGSIEAAVASRRLPRRLDGIVHSAGFVELGPVADAVPADWTAQLMVNLVGAAELTRVLLPALRTARGHVVFVNSGAGLRANPGWAAYAASKHGLRALADSLRAEEDRLRVTSVYPGRTATEMQRKVRGQEGGAYEPANYADPRTVAAVVVNALETPPDSVLTDITIR
jgi:NADP-dependent 3-hydroxy acid dehydrogenase YdfG